MAGMIKLLLSTLRRGAVAQLGERIVRNDEVVGSIPTSSTKNFQPIGVCRPGFKVDAQFKSESTAVVKPPP